MIGVLKFFSVVVSLLGAATALIFLYLSSTRKINSEKESFMQMAMVKQTRLCTIMSSVMILVMWLTATAPAQVTGIILTLAIIWILTGCIGIVLGILSYVGVWKFSIAKEKVGETRSMILTVFIVGFVMLLFAYLIG